MTDYTTIRVSTDTLATAKESKAEDETWNEYLLRCHAEGQPEVDTGEIIDELKDEISMANEPGVAVDIRGLINRIDDLEAHIDGRFDEVQR